MAKRINVTIACSLGQHNACLGTRYGKGYPMSSKRLGPCECEYSDHPYPHGITPDEMMEVEQAAGFTQDFDDRRR
jgi:hypothetical protein